MTSENEHFFRHRFPDRDVTIISESSQHAGKARLKENIGIKLLKRKNLKS